MTRSSQGSSTPDPCVSAATCKLHRWVSQLARERVRLSFVGRFQAPYETLWDRFYELPKDVLDTDHPTPRYLQHARIRNYKIV
jgi:hypothetical protein